jgi:hypothetical protein
MKRNRARVRIVIGVTPRLTGARARNVQGKTGHENAEGIASVGVRVEPPVRAYGLLRMIFDRLVVLAFIFAIVQLSSWVICKLLG